MQNFLRQGGVQTPKIYPRPTYNVRIQIKHVKKNKQAKTLEIKLVYLTKMQNFLRQAVVQPTPSSNKSFMST